MQNSFTYKTRNVCITKYARLYKLSNGIMVLPLPQGNHVAKFGKDPIYRTKVIVWKPVWTPARRTQSHNTARLETGV